MKGTRSKKVAQATKDNTLSESTGSHIKQQCKLVSLPGEIANLIFSDKSFPDIARFRQTCSEARDIFTPEAHLQMIRQVEIDFRNNHNNIPALVAKGYRRTDVNMLRKCCICWHCNGIRHFTSFQENTRPEQKDDVEERIGARRWRGNLAYTSKNVLWWKTAYAKRARLNQRWLDVGITQYQDNWHRRDLDTYPRLTLEDFDMTPNNPTYPTAKRNDIGYSSAWCKDCWKPAEWNEKWNVWSEVDE